MSDLSATLVDQKNRSVKILNILNRNAKRKLLVSELVKGKPFLELDLNFSISAEGSSFVKPNSGIFPQK